MLKGMKLRPFLQSLLLVVTASGCSETPADLQGSIELPDGFAIHQYAGDVPGARSLALGRDGTVYVGSRNAGKVYALVDQDGDQRAEQVHVLAEGLNSPNGVDLLGGDLYVAEIHRIIRFPDIANHLETPPAPEVIYDQLPTSTHHGWRYMRFGPDDRLHIAIGVPCNVCNELGVIARLASDGSGYEVFARGIRNSVGFDWHPETGVLWFTDNGRDWLGDDRPPDELNRAPEPGMHFGFPWCHGGAIQDPEFSDRPCSDFTPPRQNLGPHVAALGMRFYTGEQFPEQYHNQIFIAEHGSWNRSEPIGYRITLVRLDQQHRPQTYETFATGWLEDGKAWGRPVDLLVMPDGALLVSDDHAGKVYRIHYTGQPAGG